MTSVPDDAELIARSLDGHDDAFVEMVRRHEAAVGAYLARRVGRELAEDLLDERLFKEKGIKVPLPLG